MLIGGIRVHARHVDIEAEPEPVKKAYRNPLKAVGVARREREREPTSPSASLQRAAAPISPAGAPSAPATTRVSSKG